MAVEEREVDAGAEDEAHRQLVVCFGGLMV